jgi:hypothetical protein
MSGSTGAVGSPHAHKQVENESDGRRAHQADHGAHEDAHQPREALVGCQRINEDDDEPERRRGDEQAEDGGEAEVGAVGARAADGEHEHRDERDHEHGAQHHHEDSVRTLALVGDPVASRGQRHWRSAVCAAHVRTASVCAAPIGAAPIGRGFLSGARTVTIWAELGGARSVVRHDASLATGRSATMVRSRRRGGRPGPDVGRPANLVRA